MPPRSAKRKAAAKRPKAAPKKPDLQSVSAPDIEGPIPIQLEFQEQEFPLPVELDGDEARPPQPVNQELDSTVSFAIDEGPIISEPVEDTIVMEEVAAAVDSVMEDVVIVNDVEIQGFEDNGTVHEKNHEPTLLQNGDEVNENKCMEEEDNADEPNENKCVEEEENVDEVKENKCVEMDENASEAVSDNGSQRTFVPEIHSAVTETAAETKCDSNNVLVNEDCTEKEEADEDGAKNEVCEDDNEDYEEPSLLIDTSFTDIKRNKNLEIYIGRLDKETVEDDLIGVFGKFGELKSARIVRHPITKKSKGFAFIQFTTADHAKNALSELKDGVEVKGKHVRISASQENDTIYVGNICKTWSKENVLAALKLYGIEHFEEIHLSEDPENDGKNKGFALLEFSTHSDAMVAFNRLRKPDAVFGCNKSAKVAFTQTPMHPSEEVLSQVKRVYLEGLTKAWNEEKLKDICSQYGEIVKINLFLSPSSKRKHFGFVTFTSREGALACVEGINYSHTGEGLKASIAKPQYKGRLQKQGFRGGFMVEKQNQVSSMKKYEKPNDGAKAVETESSKAKSTVKTKQAKIKSMNEQKEKDVSTSKIVKQVILKKTGSGIEDQHVGTASNSEGTKRKRKKHSRGEDRRNGDIGTASSSEGTKRKRKKHSRGEDRRNGDIEHPHLKRPSKKSRGNEQGKKRNNSRNPNKDPRIRKGRNYSTDSTKRRNPYATGYAAPPANYHGHGQATSASASRRHYTDMEPHAGFLEPVVKQEQPHSGYNELGSRAQLLPHAGYHEPVAGRQGQIHTRYLEHTVWTQSHAGYVQNPVRPQVESHAVYLKPALVQWVHDPYSPALRRHGGPEDQGSNVYGYGGVGSVIPVSYVPNHTSHAGYQDDSSYYGNGGAYQPRRR